jgi:hypothetical protein
MGSYKTINLKPKIYETLNDLKLIPEEPMNSVVKRLILTSSLTGGTLK